MIGARGQIGTECERPKRQQHVRREEELSSCACAVAVVCQQSIPSRLFPATLKSAVVCCPASFFSTRRYTTSFTHDNTNVSLSLTLVSTRLCCLTSLPTSPFPPRLRTVQSRHVHHHRYQQHCPRCPLSTRTSDYQHCRRRAETPPLPQPLLSNTKPRAAHHSTANVE